MTDSDREKVADSGPPGPLAKKLESAIRGRMFGTRSASEIIDLSAVEPDLRWILGRLRSSSPHRRFLLLHRMDLFGEGGELQFPHFYFVSPGLVRASEPDGSPAPPRGLELVIHSESRSPGDIRAMIVGLFGIRDPKAVEQISTDFVDLLAYYLIRVFRENQALRSLVNSEDFDFGSMKRLLGDYTSTVKFDAVGRDFESLMSGVRGSTDPEVAVKLERVLTKIIQGFQQNILGMTQSLGAMIPNVINEFHLASLVWQTRVVSKAGISGQEYTEILDDLHSAHAITALNIIHWCEECSKESPLYGQTKGRIAPSKLQRNKCLSCGRTESFSAIYEINEVLLEPLLNKDGLLAVFLGYVLREEDIRFECNSESGAHEIDFVVKRDGKAHVVEVKMFRTGGDDVTKRGQLSGSWQQLIRHIESMERAGTRVDGAYLLTNLAVPTVSQIWDWLKSENEDFVNLHHPRLFDPSGVDELSRVLKA